MTDQIVPAPLAKLPPQSEDIVVLARNPAEMAVAQQELVGWADTRIAKLQGELAEMEENLRIAKSRKWKTAPWVKQVAMAKSRVQFYEKTRLALQEGYCIMPDLPVQLLAIRTDLAAPRSTITKSRYSYGVRVPELESNSPKIGEGRYVDPRPETFNWHDTRKDERGNEITTHYAKPIGFDEEFDFPVRLVKPQILDDTGKAMALKLFDEIGILPISRPGAHMMPATRSSDPVVVGRIVRKESGKKISLTFLISWWIDTRQI